MALNSEPGRAYRSLVEPYWLVLNKSWDDEASGFVEVAKTVPAPVLHLYAAHWLRSEVDNGGLLQFFGNTTGLLAPEALSGFLAIGLRDTADVVKEAMEYFGTPYPRDRATRIDALPASARDYFGFSGSMDKPRARDEWDPFALLDIRFSDATDVRIGFFDTAADAYAAGAA